MSRLSIPTTARLPSTLHVDPSNPTVSKYLNRLSRQSLISLALEWLDENHLPLAIPYLRDPEDDSSQDYENDFYPPESSPEALQEEYLFLQSRKGSKREIIERITQGDWRHGLTLYQLAMADLQYLYDHPTSQKWTAYRIVPLKLPSSDDLDGEQQQEVDKTSLVVPPFHPSVFLRSLQEQIMPDIKAHYNFDRHKTLPLLILRIFIVDSPYNSAAATTGFDSSKTFFLAFPDASPHIYLSKPQAIGTGGAGQGGESKSLRNLIVEGIPKALSRPQQRFTLVSTALTTRNLNEILERRGDGRSNYAGGGWSIYADERKGVKESPLSTVLPLPSPPLSEITEIEKGKGDGVFLMTDAERMEEKRRKRAKMVAQARFGDTGKIGDGKGVERVDLVLEDAFPDVRKDEDEEGDVTPRPKTGRKSGIEADLDRMDVDDEEGDHSEVDKNWRPYVRLTFHGSHVFAGIRQLVEAGVVDGEKMPGWMTGEEGVTMGAVRNGRIRGHKGSGL
ncbi:centromere protein Chl4/mis15/CENP-N [Podospora fimiseda]|uniref:Centromere protein Chl4/mis15/CENP-N n=1 Tax=Podospora fimiseda TaxID=252190 RepID=A0AAN7GXM1_9PEZI|nr:centromere protein Chl4/mis15/CENP-N [Podospora fimiseda]